MGKSTNIWVELAYDKNCEQEIKHFVYREIYRTKCWHNNSNAINTILFRFGLQDRITTRLYKILGYKKTALFCTKRDHV